MGIGQVYFTCPQLRVLEIELDPQLVRILSEPIVSPVELFLGAGTSSRSARTKTGYQYSYKNVVLVLNLLVD